jgi:general secretion pathway protein K
MIIILWVMTAAGVIAAAAALAGRNTVNSTRNRINLERAFWRASACAAIAQAVIDERLENAPTFEAAADTWRALDRMIAEDASAPGDRCTLSLEAAGTRIDVNSASEEMLMRLFEAMGLDDAAPALVDALNDWRDADDVPRPLGAERDWYAARGRDLPRNGPLADPRELARIRGFEALDRFESVLTTASGHISLTTAPVAVLRAVPGITRETAERIVALRETGAPVSDLLSIAGQLSHESADSLMAGYQDIARLTTANPDAWLLTVRGETGYPAVSVTLTRRLARSGRHAVVVGTRSDR